MPTQAPEGFEVVFHSLSTETHKPLLYDVNLSLEFALIGPEEAE